MLPETGRLALVHGDAQPGDALPTNPKRQAMLVRLSAETLEALESGAKVEFEFGEDLSVQSSPPSSLCFR